MVPLGDDGWRWALAVGVVPTAYAVVVRLGLPSRSASSTARPPRRGGGRGPVIRGVAPDRAGGPGTRARAGPEPETVPRAPAESRVDGAAESLWSPRLRRRTGALWTVWFCIDLSYYGAFIWLPSLLVEQGFDLVKSFQYTLVITLAQLPGMRSRPG